MKNMPDRVRGCGGVCELETELSAKVILLVFITNFIFNYNY